MMLINLYIDHTDFFISYYLYMNSSPKNRVDLCKSASKSLCSRWPLWVNQSQSVLICVKSLYFVNFFMQNKAKLEKSEIPLSPYMANGYVNLSAKSADKNKAKSNPILTPLEQKQSQTNPIQTQFFVNLGNCDLRIYSELVEPVDYIYTVDKTEK